MNIKLAAQCVLGHAASLALVFVAVPCAASLLEPVGAIVVNAPSKPVGAVGPAHVARRLLPFDPAGSTTEIVPMPRRGLAEELVGAVITLNFHRRCVPVRHSARAGALAVRRQASPTAKVSSKTDSPCRAHNHCPAFRTGTGHQPLTSIITALDRTEFLVGMFAGRAKGLLADRAYSFGLWLATTFAKAGARTKACFGVQVTICPPLEGLAAGLA